MIHSSLKSAEEDVDRYYIAILQICENFFLLCTPLLKIYAPFSVFSRMNLQRYPFVCRVANQRTKGHSRKVIGKENFLGHTWKNEVEIH